MDLVGYHVQTACERQDQFLLVAPEVKAGKDKARDLLASAESYELKMEWCGALSEHIKFTNERSGYVKPPPAPVRKTTDKVPDKVEKVDTPAPVAQNRNSLVPLAALQPVYKEAPPEMKKGFIKYDHGRKQGFFVVDAGVVRYYEHEAKEHPCELG